MTRLKDDAIELVESQQRPTATVVFQKSTCTCTARTFIQAPALRSYAVILCIILFFLLLETDGSVFTLVITASVFLINAVKFVARDSYKSKQYYCGVMHTVFSVVEILANVFLVLGFFFGNSGKFYHNKIYPVNSGFSIALIVLIEILTVLLGVISILKIIAFSEYYHLLKNSTKD